MAASVSTFVVSWNEDALMNDSVENGVGVRGVIKLGLLAWSKAWTVPV